MDVMEAIKTRRSVRKYVKKPISEKIVKEVLEAAMSAPSAGNEQPWHFVLIDNPKILSKVPTFHNHAQMLKDAAIAILVCGDMQFDEHNGMWIQDCSAATQNILLAVRAKELGAVWLGIFPREERIKGMRELLKIPDDVVPFSLISIGYPIGEQRKIDRYNNKRRHKNKW